MIDEGLAVPPGRHERLRAVREQLLAARGVVLTTHVNADGDGAGSEAAMAAWLAARGVPAAIVNPTPFPEGYRFLLPPGVPVHDPGTAGANASLEQADVLLVLDTAEPKRIGKVKSVANGRTVVVIDHHVASDATFDGVVLQDASACATAELVFDLFRIDGWVEPWPEAAREGIYTAIVTDTGSFRFSNTSPRAHVIVGSLLVQGVDPERMYRRIYGTVPLRRLRLLRHALDHLEADEAWPISWITIDRAALADVEGSAEDLEGVIEYARSIEGTEIAILFREVPDGSTKVSLRSNGTVDVNRIARAFGGGGHVKAAGAVLGEPLGDAVPRVLDEVRSALGRAGLDFRPRASAP